MSEKTPRRAIDGNSSLTDDLLDFSNGSSSDAPARAIRPSKRRRFLKILVWLLGFIFLVIVGVVGAVAVRAHIALNGIQRQDNYLPDEQSRPAPIEGPLAFVLIGNDESNLPDRQEGSRSDSLMVAYIPEDRKHVYLVSIPRDLWVEVPNRGYSKINAAYDEGGTAGTVTVVEKIFGVRMNHVGVINFQGFLELMDVLGGVDVYNSFRSENYLNETDAEPTYIYEEGMIHLEGDQGLAYVRQRKNLPNGDLDRTARQRAVIQAIIAKALSKGVLTNPVVMDDFLTKVTKVVKVDNKLTNSEIIGIAAGMKISSKDDIRTSMLPIAGYDTSNDGQSINVPDLNEIDELSQAMRTGSMDSWWEKNKDNPLLTENRPWPIGYAPLSYSTEETTSPSLGPTAPSKKHGMPVQTPTKAPR
ncbi:MAG: LCP family protein [Propionibacteriaceae bacterium]